MSPESVADWLDLLAHLRERIEAVKLQMDTTINDLIPTEIQAQIGDVRAELEPEIRAIEEKAADAEAHIRTMAIEIGATVKGQSLQAVFVKAPEKVNMEKFRGFATAHPEALALVEVGKPSVQIRKV